MIADVVEMILVDHICNFVQLYASFLRFDFRFPSDIDHADTFVGGECDEKYRYHDAFRTSEEYWD